VLEQAKALARSARIDLEASAVADDPVTLPTLTRREREVLARIEAGRTYAEIAEELFLSEKTVSSHVSNMLRKTGATNRHALAAMAREARERSG
jgi:DNA-binding CsgD family transcriptional regulator